MFIKISVHTLRNTGPYNIYTNKMTYCFRTVSVNLPNISHTTRLYLLYKVLLTVTPLASFKKLRASEVLFIVTYIIEAIIVIRKTSNKNSHPTKFRHVRKSFSTFEWWRSLASWAARTITLLVTMFGSLLLTWEFS